LASDIWRAWNPSLTEYAELRIVVSFPAGIAGATKIKVPNNIPDNKGEHAALLITMKTSRESYILDTTGAQYGHYEPLIRWEWYDRDRVNQSRPPLRQAKFFDFTKTYQPVIGTSRADPVEITSIMLSLMDKVVEALLAAIGEWERQHKGLEQLVRLSDDEYQGSSSSTLRSIEERIRAKVDELKNEW